MQNAITTVQQAQNVVNTLIAKTASNTSNINVTNIINALQSVNATTFATLTQASAIACAAKHKAQQFYKVTVTNVTLCNSNASLYSNAVNKQTSDAFTALQSNYTMLNNSYSVVALTSNTNKHYLRAIANKSISVVYYCANTNTLVSKAHVASFCTASVAAKMLSTSKTTYVKHADVTHTVVARVFKLQNIYSITLAKQTLVC